MFKQKQTQQGISYLFLMALMLQSKANKEVVMTKHLTLIQRPDQNTANVDKRKTAREVHTHGSRRADPPHDKPNKETKPNKGNKD